MPDTDTELNPSETETTGQDVQSELMDMIIADESPSTIVIESKICFLLSQQKR